MEQKGEDAVTEQLNERQEQIDILKVPHHGSKNSAKEAFLEAQVQRLESFPVEKETLMGILTKNCWNG